MSKTKLQAKAPDKTRSEPIVQRQPLPAESNAGPSPAARTTAAALPPPNGKPSAARAAEVMCAPQTSGATSKARMMQGMQLLGLRAPGVHPRPRGRARGDIRAQHHRQLVWLTGAAATAGAQPPHLQCGQLQSRPAGAHPGRSAARRRLGCQRRRPHPDRQRSAPGNPRRWHAQHRIRDGRVVGWFAPARVGIGGAQLAHAQPDALPPD
jgi:hypothetical protein